MASTTMASTILEGRRPSDLLGYLVSSVMTMLQFALINFLYNLPDMAVFTAKVTWYSGMAVGYVVTFVEEYLGWFEVISLVCLGLSTYIVWKMASYVLGFAVRLLVRCRSRKGGVDKKLDLGKGYEYAVVVKEAIHGGNELVLKVTKDLPFIVRVYVTLEDDGFFHKEEPMFRGFGWRDGDKITTAYHCVQGAVKVFISTLDSDRCVEVDGVRSHPELDEAQLLCSKQFTLLGVKKAQVKFPMPGHSCDVLTYNNEKKGFYTTHTPLMVFKDDEALQDPHYVYTRSNTKGGDSGLPVLQGGYVVATHIGSYTQKKCNVHIVPQSAVKSYETRVPQVLEVATPTVIAVESPNMKNYRKEQEEYYNRFKQLEGDSDDEDEYWREKHQKEEEEEREEAGKRSRGEHLDEQGFRAAKKKQSDKEFREKNNRIDPVNNWGDIEPESDQKVAQPTEEAGKQTPLKSGIEVQSEKQQQQPVESAGSMVSTKGKEEGSSASAKSQDANMSPKKPESQKRSKSSRMKSLKEQVRLLQAQLEERTQSSSKQTPQSAKS